jgi:ribosomal protein S15P/S13E
MPERERPQKRSQRRRGRDAVAEHRPGLPGSQQVAVLDAVRAQGHRQDHRHDLAPRIGRSGTVSQRHRLIDELLDPQSLSQQRGQHHPGIGNDPLVIKQHDRLLVHHVGDLPSEGRGCRNQPQSSPTWEVTPPQPPDRTVDPGSAGVAATRCPTCALGAASASAVRRSHDGSRLKSTRSRCAAGYLMRHIRRLGPTCLHTTKLTGAEGRTWNALAYRVPVSAPLGRGQVRRTASTRRRIPGSSAELSRVTAE